MKFLNENAMNQHYSVFVPRLATGLQNEISKVAYTDHLSDS